MTTTLSRRRLKTDKMAIINSVSSFYNTTFKELAGPRRLKSLVIPRHIAMYLLREHTEMTHEEIGFSFNRDHSSVIHAEQSVRVCIRSDEEVARQVQWIENDLIKRGSIITAESEKRAADEAIENLVGLA